MAYERVELEVETYGGERRIAYVYVGLRSRVVAEEGRSSLRYRNILVQGTRDTGLEPSYAVRLAQLSVAPEMNAPWRVRRS